MTSVGRIVQQILAGDAVVDVPTVNSIIDAATDDKSINLRDELAPLKDLFEGSIGISVHENFAEVEKKLETHRNFIDPFSGKTWTERIRRERTVDPNFANRSADEIMEKGISGRGAYTLNSTLRAGVRSTDSGKRLLESFVYGAEKLHESIGESRSRKVRKLNGLAVRNAAKALSPENLIDLLRKYEGGLSGHYPDKYECTHAHLAPNDVDSYVLGARSNLWSYLEQGFWTRLFTSDEKRDAMENDPARAVREYLEGNYEEVRGG